MIVNKYIGDNKSVSIVCIVFKLDESCMFLEINGRNNLRSFKYETYGILNLKSSDWRMLFSHDCLLCYQKSQRRQKRR